MLSINFVMKLRNLLLSNVVDGEQGGCLLVFHKTVQLEHCNMND